MRLSHHLGILKVVWFLASTLGTTGIYLFSHWGAAAMHNFSTQGLNNAQSAGVMALIVFSAVALAYTVISYQCPPLHRRSRGALVQSACLLLSGLPWTFLWTALAHLLNIDLLWRFVPLGGAIGFVLWARLVSRAKPPKIESNLRFR